MSQPMLQPIPVTIISGFLGAGKTSLLNHILYADHGLKVAVLVNDFGEINIDAQLVVGIEGETIALSNGCICCSIRGDLVDAVIKVANRAERPDYMIIETSGVSDPVAVAMTFRMPEMMYFVQLDSLITLVDAENFLLLDPKDLKLGIAQLEMADIVVLNKVDTVTPEYLQKVRDEIHHYSPRARLIETTFGKVPLELVLGVGNFAPERLQERVAKDVHVHGVGDEHGHDHDEHDEHEHDHTLVYSTWNWQSDKPLALDRVRAFVNRLPKTLYRAKGVIYLQDIPEHKAVFQLVGKRAGLVLAEEWGATPPLTQIVFISSYGGLDTDTLRAQLEACTEPMPVEEDNSEWGQWKRS